MSESILLYEICNCHVFLLWLVHLEPLLDQGDILEWTWEKFELGSIVISCDLGQRYPFSYAYLLNVLNIYILLLIWPQDTHNIEISSTVLVVHLLSHCKNTLEWSFHTSLFHHFTLHSLLDCLPLVDKTSRELPFEVPLLCRSFFLN